MDKKAIFIGIFCLSLIVFIAGCVEPTERPGSKDCINNNDCVVFGKTGDCNCGCFNKDHKWQSGGECFCAAPKSCKCVNGKCEGIFEEEFCNGMSLTEAKQIAIDSECGDRLKETYMCNNYTNTWWIDLDIEKEMCNPACVINIGTKKAEINWRCMGLLE